MDTRNKLASHLYSALALAPLPIPVARLTHPVGLEWTLVQGLITITLGGSQTHDVPATSTVADLLNDLLDFGVNTTFTDPDLLGVPASALLSGTGSDASSATDALELFATPLWTMLDAYGVELDDAAANLIQALDQIYMDTADGEILDVWGRYFGVPRRALEDDPTYYARIVREVLRPRANRFAIEAAVFDNTGLIVSLREPFREIFRCSISGLSGSHHLQDGHFYTWNVFQPVYVSPITLAQRNEILAVIERNRPAGCLIVGADVQPPTGYAEASISSAGLSSSITLVNYMGNMTYETGLLSSTLYLSNERERINSQLHWTQYGDVTVLTGTEDTLDLFVMRSWTGGWDNTIWSRPSVSSVVTQHPA